MNKIESNPSNLWVPSTSSGDNQKEKSSIVIGKKDALTHQFTSHTHLNEKEKLNRLNSSQIQGENKIEAFRKNWIENSTFVFIKKEINFTISCINKNIKNIVNKIKLEMSSLFNNYLGITITGIATIQSCLRNENLKEPLANDETLTLENGTKFSLPHQFNRDMIGCLYFLNNNDFLTTSSEDLVENSIIDLTSKDIIENKEPQKRDRSDAEARLQTGLMLQNKFGKQTFLNIASILTQGSLADLIIHV